VTCTLGLPPEVVVRVRRREVTDEEAVAVYAGILGRNMELVRHYFSAGVCPTVPDYRSCSDRKVWRSLRDSNPCYRRERAVS
jgi:hypothetical protein